MKPPKNFRLALLTLGAILCILFTAVFLGTVLGPLL